MLSMTGFGRSTLAVNEGIVTVEIKTVNHRFLEIRSKISQEFSNAESGIEKLVRKKIKRGFCNINISFEPNDNVSTLKVNTSHLNSYLDDLEIVAKKHNISVESLLPVISQAPDLLAGNIIEIKDFKEKALTACESAIDELIKMRTSEGSAMAINIDEKLNMITTHIDKIESLAKVHDKSVFKQFKDKIESILDETGRQKDIDRIETEAAIL
ncbi:MAG: hypothetical protein JXR91_11695, partial [Deltaproteobacteria bacterium]|nr:hypothetical protein [Deltaproteobacteria bacterium]